MGLGTLRGKASCYRYLCHLLCLDAYSFQSESSISLRRCENGKKRSPLSRNLLRSPDESLRKKYDDLIRNIAVDLTALPLLPLLLYTIHLTQSYLLNQVETVFRICLTVGLSLIVFLYLVYKLINKLRRVWKLRLGYEAEQAMGQELDQLMRHGAVVFHDLPADGFNIDHIAVTPKGVYAVEGVVP